jgi:Fe-S-cluster formation regulator IscX/YfhJ
MLGSNNIGDHVLSLKFEPNQQKICNLQQFSSNSHENSSMLGSNNIGDHVLSLKFEPNQQKICNLTQFSDNSPENLQKKLICLAQ